MPIPVNTETATTAVGGVGAAGLLSWVATRIWRIVASSNREARKLAEEAVKKAAGVEADVASLRSELNLKVADLSSEIKAVRSENQSNASGIAGIQASIVTLNAAASADRTANAGIMGELTGFLRGKGLMP